MISKEAKIGKNVVIKEGAIIEKNVSIGDNCYIDYNAIIKENVILGENSFVGAGSILGEYLFDFFENKINQKHVLSLGKNAIIRSRCILYGGSTIGDNFSTGHQAVIRENTTIGNHVNIGTLSDVQGDCQIGNYVHLHSNVHVGMKTIIKDYSWIFPYVVFTNDPTPPSEILLGATVEEFAVICTGSIVLPGIHIGKDALVGASTNVTKDVPELAVVVGNPGKVIGNVTNLKDKRGRTIYPWRYTFDRGMPWKGTPYKEWEMSNK